MAARRFCFLKLAAAACMLAPFLAATLAAAVEVRQPETGARFDASLVRAYAECTAPDTVARSGAPACTARVTSTCTPFGSTLALSPPVVSIDPDSTVPDFVGPASGTGPAGICRTGDFDFVVRARLTTGVALEPDPDDPDAPPPCPSGFCTYPDQELSLAFPAANRADQISARIEALPPRFPPRCAACDGAAPA